MVRYGSMRPAKRLDGTEVTGIYNAWIILNNPGTI